MKIVILTGAGISAESGIATFRDSGGLWNNYRVEDVATPEGFRANPELVHNFYNMRRRELKNVEPNPAHYALAKLENELNGDITVVTQNVDNLHERAGTKSLLHMHGELLKIKCTSCGRSFHTEEDCFINSTCPNCKKTGYLRPDIVWFGEMPEYMVEITNLLYKCNLFISIGTSGAVYPAAGFVRIASPHAHTVELNMEASLGSSHFNEKIYGKASQIVPAYVDKILEMGKDILKNGSGLTDAD